VAVLNSLFLLWLFLEDEIVKGVSISALYQDYTVQFRKI
jgi:hypothetical protein